MIFCREEFPAAWMNLGIVKAMKGQHEDALSCYQKAMKYRKNYATCIYNLGNLVDYTSNTVINSMNWSSTRFTVLRNGQPLTGSSILEAIDCAEPEAEPSMGEHNDVLGQQWKDRRGHSNFVGGPKTRPGRFEHPVYPGECVWQIGSILWGRAAISQSDNQSAEVRVMPFEFGRSVPPMEQIR